MGFNVDCNQRLTDEKWKAIINNDASYNNQFLYAVKTTRIFCKTSCPSRIPNRENVLIFQNAKQALAENYRPCKRCKPTNEKLPDHEWVAIITDYIEKYYTQKLSLKLLAEISHGSPYHLHRTFKKVQGVTPLEYIQVVRINVAKHYLKQSDWLIEEIARAVGMSNTSYFITLFKKMSGITPAQYREQNRIGKEIK